MTKLFASKVTEAQYMLVVSRRGVPHKDTIFSLTLAFLMLLIGVKIGARQPARQRLARNLVAPGVDMCRRWGKRCTDCAQSSPSPAPARPVPICLLCRSVSGDRCYESHYVRRVKRLARKGSPRHAGALRLHGQPPGQVKGLLSVTRPPRPPCASRVALVSPVSKAPSGYVVTSTCTRTDTIRYHSGVDERPESLAGCHHHDQFGMKPASTVPPLTSDDPD